LLSVNGELISGPFSLVSLPESYRQGTLEDYHVRRIMLGVPEGMDDFIAGMSLPLECNLDYMNGGKVPLMSLISCRGVTRSMSNLWHRTQLTLEKDAMLAKS